MHHPTDRIVHTTAFVTPVVEHWLEREIGIKHSVVFSTMYSGLVHTKDPLVFIRQ